MFGLLLGLFGVVGVGVAVASAGASSAAPSDGTFKRSPIFAKPTPLLRNTPDGLPSIAADDTPSKTPNGDPVVGQWGTPDWPLMVLTLTGAYYNRGFGKRWVETTPSVGQDLAGRVQDAVVTKVIPAMQAVLVAAGGPAGFGAAMALGVWANLAKGAKITDALIDATQAQIRTAIERSQFAQTVRDYASTPISKAALATAREQFAKKYVDGGPTQAGMLQSFDAAAALARAQRLQNYLIADFKTRIPAGYHQGLDTALAEGFPLQDWLYAYAGDAALTTFDQLSLAIAQRIDQGLA